MSGIRPPRCRWLVGATLLGLVACAEEPPPEPIRPVVSTVIQGPEALGGRWWPGRAKATLEVDLGFEVSGQLKERSVDVGDEVETGQVLARIDERDYRNQLIRAKAERDRAKVHYDRLVDAARTGAVARQDVDDARARLDQAEASVRIRQKAVDDSRLIAPFDGLVSATFVDNFQNVRVKEPVIRLLDVSRLEIVVNIPENLINFAAEVTDIQVRFDAVPDLEIPATIKEVGREASAATRTFPITLIFDPKHGGADIQPGMAGQARGKSPSLDQTEGLEVPVAAVFTPDGADSDASYVWVVDEDQKTVSRREVEQLAISPRGGAVVLGLQPGERVVTAGVHRLREGQQVLIP